MAGTIIVDRIESDASYASTINVAGQITFSNTVNFGAFAGTAPVAGFYLPTTNNLAFTTASTERMRITSAGNVGIGTSSPTSLLHVSSTTANPQIKIVDLSIAGGRGGSIYGSYGGNGLYLDSLAASGWVYIGLSPGGGQATNIRFDTSNTERMRIDSSGNLLVGTTSTLGAKFALYGTASGTNSVIQITNPGIGTGCLGVQGTSSNFKIYNCYTSGTLGTGAGIDIDVNGSLLVGTTDTAFSSGVGAKFVASATVPNMGYVVNTAGNLNTYHFYNTNATNNGFRFYVNINGGIYNFSGNNSNLSDERKKTNIELSGNYLDKICAIPVKLFNYKDEPTGEQRTLGVIAQDVEAVAPELVNNEGFGETPEGEAPLKSVYTTDMMFALMKCIQEQQAIIQTLTDRITALESN